MYVHQLLVTELNFSVVIDSIDSSRTATACVLSGVQSVSDLHMSHFIIGFGAQLQCRSTFTMT